MKINHCLARAVCGVALLWATAASASPTLPPATNVLSRILERASRVASGPDPDIYCYAKLRRMEELNSKGAVTESKERRYEVILIRGWPFNRLVEVQGQKLSRAELLKEQRREEEFRNKMAGHELRQKKEKREAWITPDLLDRFEWNVVSNDVCGSRSALVLSFKAKPSNQEDSIQDRIMNRFAGLLWIDSEDAEIARVDAQLTEDISIGWLGALGSLSQCHLQMERRRMPEGVWVITKNTLLIMGRKLVSPMRFRMTEESSNFHPGSEEAPEPAPVADQRR